MQLHTTRLNVSDMSCGHCEKRVVAALKAVPGVRDASASHSGSSATVSHTAEVGAAALAQVVEAAGYPASVEGSEEDDEGELPGGAAQILLAVEGMTCGHCERAVVKALTAVKGVVSAQASFKDAQVTVTCEGAAPREALVQAIVAAGYEVPDTEGADPAAAQAAAGPAARGMDIPAAQPGGEVSEGAHPPEGGAAGHVRLDVGGMSCASCVSRIETRLNGVPGVRGATVNLLAHRAEIHFDPALTSGAALVDAIIDTGYTARIAEVRPLGARRAPEPRVPHQALRIAFTLVAGVVAMIVSMPLMDMHAADPLSRLLMPMDHALAAALPWLYGVPPATLRWALLALSLPVVLWAGRHFYVKAFALLRHGSADMNTLIALGTGAAFVLSAGVTVAPGAAQALGLPLMVWYEAIPWVMGLVMLGNLLEDRAKQRTSRSIEALAGLQVKTARRLRDGLEEDVPLEALLLGDAVRVRPGERVPVDGVVVEGRSAVDASMLTGEPVPEARGPGDPVFSGTVNGAGALVVKATALGEQTALARIVQMVEEAQGAKPEIQRLADRIAGVFVPAVVAIAVVSAVVWALVGPAPAGAYAVRVFMTVLIIACPCAMGLAVPTAVMVAVGRAAQAGVLVRSGVVLEQGHRVDTVVLDKTGTLTEGHPEVVQTAGPGVQVDAVVAAVAALEQQSEHPLGAAIVRWAQGRGAVGAVASDVLSEAGGGVSGRVDGQQVRVGTLAFVGGAAEALKGEIAEFEARGHTPVVATVGERALAFGIADPVRQSSRAAVARLQALGIEVIVLSGDREGAVAAAARAVGADRYIAQASPETKLEQVQALRQQGKVVAMVGDGINDAPALAAADVGIAMGTGADVAMATADVTLMHADLNGVADVLDLSHQTLRIIKQNLGWAFGYNLVGIPIAAGVLYPVAGFLLTPVFASAAMALSSVSVVSNALRLRRWAPTRAA